MTSLVALARCFVDARTARIGPAQMLNIASTGASQSVPNGGGWGDWRHPDANPRGSTDIDLYKHQAAVAEAAKFDFLFVADSVHINERSSPHCLNRFEPLTILSALGAVTQRLRRRQR